MRDRYSRQILFEGIGKQGQKKLGKSSAVLVGCGALGTVTAELLTRAGIGSLKLIDRDFVEESNLQRQSLFTEEDAKQGLPKAAAAQKALQSINSQVEVQGLILDVTWENIGSLCEGHGVIIDGTDNFETRFLINDLSVSLGLPWIYGACVGSYGLAFSFQPNATPCLQCLFEDPPPTGETETCDTVGIISPVVHVISAYQVTQAMKILTDQTPDRSILQVDLWTGLCQRLSVQKARSQSCDCCKNRNFRFLQGQEQTRMTRLCGRNAVQVSPRRRSHPDFQQISSRLGKTAQIERNEYLMRIRVDGFEIALFADGRSIIRGTDDCSKARAVYAKYVGN